MRRGCRSSRGRVGALWGSERARRVGAAARRPPPAPRAPRARPSPPPPALWPAPPPVLRPAPPLSSARPPGPALPLCWGCAPLPPSSGPAPPPFFGPHARPPPWVPRAHPFLPRAGSRAPALLRVNAGLPGGSPDLSAANPRVRGGSAWTGCAQGPWAF